ncbi:MAG: heparan-alpha-glucosaminide N-acetyltransferase domain-containing protein [Maribacter sp.]|uniref:heparan-alpha-glucosaminide N-acetyltransferase domain-containing protein n=1 Tax=Maribacter sp. TaxID=1897614 RepID=UPI003C785151
MTKAPHKTIRIASIDVLRAMTMLLMIWVNDFWTLTDIPKWLMHAKPNEDYLGFSDIIFPLFLFIVGLSIPFAIQNRMVKKEPRIIIAKHIIIRSLSLLIIGVFMVNYETHHETLGLGKAMWCFLMALAVSLVWMQWKKSPIPNKWHNYLKMLGWALLLGLALLYKGGTTGDEEMAPHWWGILGLIGWAYSINALAFLFSKGRLVVIVSLWLLFNVLSIADAQGLLHQFPRSLSYFSTWVSGTIPAFTAAGVVASLLFQKISKLNRTRALTFLGVLGCLNIAAGLITRHLWGISKVPGTPSWLLVCTGIGFLSFVVFYFIVDIKKQRSWAKIIIPAGTATLTCYLIPYFTYPIRTLTGIELPDILNTGVIGLLSSFCFALLVVIFTGWLQKRGFSLKL